MKTLYLVRHAKSSWDNPEIKDYDRPLNSRGKKDAPNMGKRLTVRKITPDLILSSPANRAYTTAVIIASHINYPEKDIKTHEDIYHAEKRELISVIKKQNNKYDSIMLFGHNPGFTRLANSLTNEDIDNIPTCGVFGMQFNMSDWSLIEETKGSFLFFDFPKNPFQEKFLS